MTNEEMDIIYRAKKLIYFEMIRRFIFDTARTRDEILEICAALFEYDEEYHLGCFDLIRCEWDKLEDEYKEEIKE